MHRSFTPFWHLELVEPPHFAFTPLFTPLNDLRGSEPELYSYNFTPCPTPMQVACGTRFPGMDPALREFGEKAPPIRSAHLIPTLCHHTMPSTPHPTPAQGDCGARFPWIEPALREFGEKALRSAQGSGQTNEQALEVSVGFGGDGGHGWACSAGCDRGDTHPAPAR